jgi:predicted nucleic acid-binding protein
MKNICVDACFLIALYDPHDKDHVAARTLFEQLFDESRHRMIVPWPILYETVSTRLARRSESVQWLHREWTMLQRQKRLEPLFDRKLRQRALDETFGEMVRGANYRALSLVDRVIRLMLQSSKLRLNAFITFNRGDFEDVCRARRIQLVDEALEA